MLHCLGDRFRISASYAFGRVDIAAKYDFWPDFFAYQRDVHHVIDIENIDAKGSDPIKQVCDITANMQFYVRASRLDRIYELLFTREDDRLISVGRN